MLERFRIAKPDLLWREALQLEAKGVLTMQAASRAKAVQSRLQYRGQGDHKAWVTAYFGTEPLSDPSLPRPDPGSLFPVAFMVEEEPNAALGAHFHDADQFQVFVSGKGLLGRRPVGRFSVHYADAFTPYGPIQAGPEGLAYFTLRNAWDSGPKYMPQSHDLLRARPARGRQMHPKAIPDLELEGAVEGSSLIEIQAPGAVSEPAIWLSRNGPHKAVSTPAVAGGGGQYWLVARGAFQSGDLTFDALSCLFLAPGESPPSAVAGVEGVDVLILQFPQLGPHLVL